MRVFFAVDLSGEIRQNIVKLISKCRTVQPEGVAYTAPDNLHVTLKFLGDLGEETVRELADETAGLSFPALTAHLTVRGAGAFPNAVFPKVLWAGVEDEGVLTGLFSGLEAIAEKHGVPRDGRPFHPHVTIGRVKTQARRELAELIKRCSDHFGDHAAPEFVLYKSDLSRSGPVYTKVRAFPFGGGKS